jgi:hypothetical protein
VLTAYVLPATAIWALAGLALCALPLSTAALILAAVYGLSYGAAEVSGAVWLPAPGRRWQVPQDLVIGAGRRRRVLIWGAILGPGFLTRNPYAGFAVLPVLVAACARTAGGSLTAAVSLAALTGAAHAAGRALALARDSAARPDDPIALVLRQMRWRAADGYALLVIAGAASVALWQGLR